MTFLVPASLNIIHYLRSNHSMKLLYGSCERFPYIMFYLFLLCSLVLLTPTSVTVFRLICDLDRKLSNILLSKPPETDRSDALRCNSGVVYIELLTVIKRLC